jgi:hypothetical protein
MPVWKFNMADTVKRYAAKAVEMNAIRDSIARLERPGNVEAILTEHILKAAGIDLTDLEGRIRELGK